MSKGCMVYIFETSFGTHTIQEQYIQYKLWIKISVLPGTQNCGIKLKTSDFRAVLQHFLFLCRNAGSQILA